MRARFALTAGLAAIALLLFAHPCPAQIPHQMNYQVMLTDDADQPLASQSVQMVFRLYDQETGGGLYWTETQNVTTNSIGVVSVALGSVNPIGFFTFGPQWLEVEIDGEVMTPRRQLLEAPYAKVAGEAAHAADSDCLGEISFDQYATYSVLSSPGSINSPMNPLEWTRLKNVPGGFADGVDDAGEGDGHSLDASDGNPADVVRVDADGMVEVGFGTTITPTDDYALSVGGSNVWGGIVAQTDRNSPFAAGVLAGTSTFAGVLGAAYDTPPQMFLYGGKQGVAGSLDGEGFAGCFIAADAVGEALYCGNTGGGTALHADSWGFTGYSGLFEGGSGVLVERDEGIPAFEVEHLATSGWGDAAYFSSNAGVESSTWALNATCYEGSAGRFSKSIDDDVYAVYIYGDSSTSEGLYVYGTVASTGLTARGVETSRGVEPVFGVSSPDVELVASGKGRLTDGAARIDFEDIFAESITGPADLRVTATPVGRWSAIYVERKDEGGFELRSESGDLNVEFDWVAIGRARGHGERPQVTIPDLEEEARIVEAKAAEMEATRPVRREPPKIIRGMMP